MIPLPFTKVNVIFGDLVFVPPDADMEDAVSDLQRILTPEMEPESRRYGRQ
jgi:lysophospholipid acyltransferase (LPLAT)-like uncharacterized protein